MADSSGGLLRAKAVGKEGLSASTCCSAAFEAHEGSAGDTQWHTFQDESTQTDAAF